ncbi:30S ribosomal protein S20 [Candidatus Peregrinibacteria bacterium]|nr:30S ribosomal protein S20 [Candidatus Peregrinibacteria bacterium]
MPIIKSAKKAMRQAEKRTALRKPFKTKLKNTVKKVLTTAKTDKEAAKKELSAAYKAIDIAAKKNILHKNTAARRKSRLAKAVEAEKK